jgi:hypothetical protein
MSSRNSQLLKLDKEDYLILGCVILGGAIFIILNEIIMKIIMTFITCYVTILLYRILVGYCFIQTKLNEVRTFSDASNKRFKESRKGNRQALVIGFTIPNTSEGYDLLKVIPRLVLTNI